MIKIGIVGYGNIGKGAVRAVEAASDMELVAVFTRRKQGLFDCGFDKYPFLAIEEAKNMIDDIDVMLLCGGSAADLPEQTPYFASMFNTVDSYDNHAEIPGYITSIDAVAKDKVAIVSTGWDPGLFSMMRLLYESVLPDGSTYTFYGRGVSQGHSNAIRKVAGVIDAVQYTVPIESAVNEARSGAAPVLEARQRMMRECYVVVEPAAEKDAIESTIKTMPHYFSDYDTTVTFVDEHELREKHSKMSHGGLVLRSGNTDYNKHLMEFSLNLDSNPQFTANIMVAYARAAYRMSKEGAFGAKTVFDVPPVYLSETDRDESIKNLL